MMTLPGLVASVILAGSGPVYSSWGRIDRISISRDRVVGPELVVTTFRKWQWRVKVEESGLHSHG